MKLLLIGGCRDGMMTEVPDTTEIIRCSNFSPKGPYYKTDGLEYIEASIQIYNRHILRCGNEEVHFFAWDPMTTTEAVAILIDHYSKKDKSNE